MGPRIYPSDQNVSQLLPLPTPSGSVTPTPTPTITPTPTPTPVPGVPIITTGLRLYVDGQSISYPGTGTTWYNLSTTASTLGDCILVASPNFNYTTSKNYFNFNGLNHFTYNVTDDSPTFYGYNFTFGGWVNVSLGPTKKFLYSRGEGLETIGGGTEYVGASLVLYKNENDYLEAGVRNWSGGPFPYVYESFITSSTKLPNDTWVYVTMRYTYNSSAELFINGVQVATGSVPSVGQLMKMFNPVCTTCIGWNAGINTGNYTPNTRMSIGDFEVYQIALSDVQILSNYNAQSYKYI